MNAHSPTLIAALPAANNDQEAAIEGVGAVLQTMQAARAIGEAEIRAHIQDCGFLMQVAYQRFETYGDPADRDTAVLWLHHQQEAQRHLQRLLDDGVDFFQSPAALAMSQPGWRGA